MATTYAKLRTGQWGIRTTEKIVVGQRVTVAKKDGTTKQEVVGKIVWQGKGITLATVYQEPKKRKLSDEDRCEVCDGNKYTCGHCVGW